MNRAKAVILIVMALLAGCVDTRRDAPVDADPASALQLHRVHREHPIPGGTRAFRIENDFGDIYLRKMPTASLGIHANVQVVAGQPLPEVTLDVADGEARLRVEPHAGSPGRPRVDLAVYLPAHETLSVRTMAGNISGNRIESDWTAETDSGSIKGSASGRMDLRTGSGAIRVTHIGGKWPGQSMLTSDTGLIVVGLPPEAAIALEAEAGAGLTTDFDDRLSITRKDANHLTGHLAGEGERSRLVVRTRGEAVLRAAYQSR